MRLSRAMEEKLMDVRLRDKLIGEGKISKEQVKKYLDSLSDDQKNATFTEGLDLDDEE
jgi:polyhydroxyalkanoate synthesis regulator phasin